MARFGRSQPHAPIYLRGTSTVPLALAPKIHVVLTNRRADRNQTRYASHIVLLHGARSLVPDRLAPQFHVDLQTRQFTRDRRREQVQTWYLRPLLPAVAAAPLPGPQLHVVLQTRARNRDRIRGASHIVFLRGVLWGRIGGITRDNTGAPLGLCTVHLYRTSDDVKVGSTTSDAGGNYAFTLIADATTYYCVAYLAGAPDVAGTTDNTLVAA